eukprot:scaffold30_cov416-Prasinococcus_capsulatus_cf.AAC.32
MQLWSGPSACSSPALREPRREEASRPLSLARQYGLAPRTFQKLFLESRRKRSLRLRVPPARPPLHSNISRAYLEVPGRGSHSRTWNTFGRAGAGAESTSREVREDDLAEVTQRGNVSIPGYQEQLEVLSDLRLDSSSVIPTRGQAAR